MIGSSERIYYCMIVALPLLSWSPLLLLLLFYFLTGILYYAPWSLEPLQGRRIRSTLFLGKKSLFLPCRRHT